jgi:hypothetical protein
MPPAHWQPLCSSKLCFDTVSELKSSCWFNEQVAHVTSRLRACCCLLPHGCSHQHLSPQQGHSSLPGLCLQLPRLPSIRCSHHRIHPLHRLQCLCRVLPLMVWPLQGVLKLPVLPVLLIVGCVTSRNPCQYCRELTVLLGAPLSRCCQHCSEITSIVLLGPPVPSLGRQGGWAAVCGERQWGWRQGGSLKGNYKGCCIAQGLLLSLVTCT